MTQEFNPQMVIPQPPIKDPFRPIPDPAGLDEERIQTLDLDTAGWQSIMEMEKIGRNRPHIVEYARLKALGPHAVVIMAAPEEFQPVVLDPGPLDFERKPEGLSPDPGTMTAADVMSLE